jgi:serine/threonine-protein kinase HipA
VDLHHGALTHVEARLVAVGNCNVILVKRFDRTKLSEDYTRARMISALTLLRSEDTMEARKRGEWSYLALVEELRRVSADPKRDAQELFRRMCFNAAASNLDDHARNHALIAIERDWRLSPAYDLTPSPSVGMERFLQMTAGDQGTRATAENLLSQAHRFMLQRDEAEKIVPEIAGKIRSRWYGVARGEQVTEGDCELIRPAFENEGFNFAKAAVQKPKPKAKKKKGASRTAAKGKKAKTTRKR